MTLRRRMSSLLVLALILPGGALAQVPQVGPKIGVGLGFGSLGVGGDLSVGLTPRLEARGGLNYFKVSLTNKSISDVAYDVSAKWVSGAVGVDLYLAGPLRMSGALLWNGNQLTIDANPTVSVTIGDTTYTATDVGTINGKIDFKKVAPYVGIGLAGRGKVSLVLQAGIVLQGAPRVSYTATTSLTGAAKTRFDQEVQQEVAKIQDDLSFFKYYPHVALGLAIRL